MKQNRNFYYIYHIPGIKVGVTTNIGERVIEQQGYDPMDIELLDMSKDINVASRREIELQKFFGYRVDEKLYKDLFPFKINVTDMTTTFPCEREDLKTYLTNNKGRTIKLLNGQSLEVNDELIEWCNVNSTRSMYTDNRCYVYNNALIKALNK